MKTMLPIGCAVLVSVLACRSSDRKESEQVAQGQKAEVSELPGGDPTMGRQVFMEMRCHTCHRVEGGGFPDPVATPEVPVMLGKAQAGQSRGELMEPIIAPSCRIPEDLPDVRSGSLSRMGDYSGAMTVEELMNLVAFVQSLGDA